MIKTLQHNNLVVAYRIDGDGETVLLIHGFAEDGSVWDRQAAHLSKQYRVIVPDLPSSGLSAAGAVSMEALAEVVYHIIAAESVTDCVIIGHSMGGYVTLAFAEKYPNMLKGFGLFHSSAFADSEEKIDSRKKSIAFIRSHGTEAFLRQSVPGTFSDDFMHAFPHVTDQFIERYKDFDAASLISYYEAMIERPDRTHVLKTSLSPVLFIIGQHDKAIPPNDSLQQSHLPAKSYIHILSESGHMGMYEEPDKSNQVLEEFLRDIFM